jgi:hypothetical protein
MKMLLIPLAALILAGCATKQTVVEQQVVVKYEYIMRVPPEELMSLPPPVKPIEDIDNATQGDVARWIVRQQERIAELEKRIIEIAKFLKGEQDKLEQESVKKSK